MKRNLLKGCISVLLFCLLFGFGALPGEAQDAKKLRVALCLAQVLGDQSFSDSAYNGFLQAKKEFSIETKLMEGNSPADHEPNMVAMASAGYDLIVVTSTLQIEVVKKVAPQFPNTKFAMIDGVVHAPNVESYIFAQNEGSFLAGVAAALFTQKTDIPGVNSQKVVGFVGGVDIPVIRDFLTGYEQGVKYADPDTKVLVSFAGSFRDPLKGKELTLAQYGQGADIVYNVASNTGNGILEAASETKKFAIGVDMNQDSLYPGHILTSMLKRVDQAVYQAIASAVKGEFKGDNIVTMGLANGGVSLTDMSVMKKALGDKFPQDVLDTANKLTEEVKAGKIKIDSYPGFQRK